MPELPMISAGGGIQDANRPKPPIAPGAASEGLSEVGAMASDLGTKILDIRRQTQLNMSSIDYHTAAEQKAQDIQMDPQFRSDPIAARAEFQRWSDAQPAQLSQKYPLANWNGEMARSIGIWGAKQQQLIFYNAHANQVKDTDDEFDVYQAKATLAASDPTLNSDARQVLASDFQKQARANVASGMFTQGEADLRIQKFQMDVATGSAKNWAIENPHAMLALDAPPKEVTGGVTLPATLVAEMKNTALAQLRRPMEQINASNEATRANLITTFNQQAAAGKLDTGAVNQAVAHSLISPDDYKKLFGYAYLPAGNPEAIKDMTDQIKRASSDDELGMLQATVQGQVDKEVYGRGAIGLTEQIQIQKRQIKSTGGRARAAALDQINASFDSIHGFDAEMYDATAKLGHLPTIAASRARAIASFKAHTTGVDDPAKINDALNKALAEHAPDLSIVSDPAKLNAALHGTNPARKPGESDADWGHRLRKAMALPAATPMPEGVPMPMLPNPPAAAGSAP